MQNSQIKRLLKAFGAETRVAWARWAPSSSATQTLTEAHGISSISRTGSLAELVALSNDLKAKFNAHLIEATVHIENDEDNTVLSADATDLPTSITLLNEILTAYAAHRVSTDFHDVADTTNTVASSACTDRVTAVTLANQLKTAFNAHRTQATVHPVNDATNVVTAVLNVTGCYRLNLTDKFRAAMVMLSYVENDTTHYHFVEPTALAPLERTIDVRHRSVAYASVASGPSASDTVDEMQVVVFLAPNAVKGGGQHKILRAYGPKCELAYVRWSPSGSATQTITEAFGVSSVTRSGAGAYTVNLARKCKALVAIPFTVENDTTNYHWTEVTATSASAGTVTMRHRTAAYASVTSAPTASDTVDELECLVIMRVADGTTAGATDSKLLHDVYCYGPAPFLARARWTPTSDAVQTMTENLGIATVSRSGAGAYSANLTPNGIKALAAVARHIENDTTNYHWTEVTATSAANRTISVRHRTQAFADVATAPTASDTVDQLEVFALCRCSS